MKRIILYNCVSCVKIATNNIKVFIHKYRLVLTYLISVFVIASIYYQNPQYGLYLIRWQLSTPTLAIFSAATISKLTGKKLTWANKYEWAGATVANLIGGLVFYWFDKILIFNV